MAKTQTLWLPIRLPDAMQAEALRLLDGARLAIKQIMLALWPHVDLFAADGSGPACKHVEKHLIPPGGHGSRQGRHEMEAAGRIVRAQPRGKHVFHTSVPLLTDGLILPGGQGRPARNEHREISERVRTLPAQIPGCKQRVEDYDGRIKQCWKKYERRKRERAHLASNLLILLAVLDDGRIICGEKRACLWNGARDYAASLNIASLGRAFLITSWQTGKYTGFRMTCFEVKPVSYSGTGARLLLPWQGLIARPSEGNHVDSAGWSYSLRFCTSQSKTTLSLLSTSQLRKRVLTSASCSDS
jgi:hypothetical protein